MLLIPEILAGAAARAYAPMPLATQLFMVKPDFFTIDRAINSHMVSASGQLHQVDLPKAYEQWRALVAAYETIGYRPHLFSGGEGLADMVFCANQTLPFWDEEGPGFLLSQMADGRRQREVPLIERALRGLGQERLVALGDENLRFEGMGDALWVPGRQLLCGGFGPRTVRDSYAAVHRLLGVPIALFELGDPKFYHLDTCLAMLSDEAVLACEEAFAPTGWRRLNELFPRLIKVPLKEADAPGFACNAHCPDGKHVIIQAGNVVTEAALKTQGFLPVPVDTSEFIKSGGSVFCMKMMFF